MTMVPIESLIDELHTDGFLRIGQHVILYCNSRYTIVKNGFESGLFNNPYDAIHATEQRNGWHN